MKCATATFLLSLSAAWVEAANDQGPPLGWHAEGCWSDGVNGVRALASYGPVPANAVSPRTCIAACAGQGFKLAGVEWGQECYCGNTIMGFNAQMADDSACDTDCVSTNQQKCGGYGALNLYVANGISYTTGGTPEVLQTVGQSGEWTNPTCYVDDDANNRILPDGDQAAWQTLTPADCAAACENYGYAFTGLEYGRQCFCGSTAPDSSRTVAPIDDCNMGCFGDGTANCGGGSRMLVYQQQNSSLPTAQKGRRRSA